MEGINLAKNIITEVNSKIKRVYWTNKQIEKYFAKRTVKEIINQGNTCYMNPCSDLTLVTSEILSKNKIQHNWIIEEHFPTKDFNFNRLHFALEFVYKEKIYFINYKRLNEVYVNFGKYKGREDLLSSLMIKFPHEGIDFNKSLHKNILNSKLKSKLENFSLRKNIDRLKKDNSLENYNNYKNKNINKFIIKN